MKVKKKVINTPVQKVDKLKPKRSSQEIIQCKQETKRQLEAVLKTAKHVYDLDALDVHAIVLSLLSDVALEVRQAYGRKEELTV